MNYCTFWPEWLEGVYIGGCCKAHDLAYDLGAPRVPSDIALGECVADLGLPLWGKLMTAAVLIFGGLFYKRKRT